MKNNRTLFVLLVFSIFALLLSACQMVSSEEWELRETMSAMQANIDTLSGGATVADTGELVQEDLTEADVNFTLETATDGASLVFVGVGGEIDGQINPTLQVVPGAIVEITLINGMPTQHDLLIDEFGANSGLLLEDGQQVTFSFVAAQEGSFEYYCSVPGHRLAGMEGLFIVGEPARIAEAQSIVKNPSDLPAPIGARAPELVQVELVGQEVVGQLDDGATFTYFTFNGTVPGPFIRARVGDTIEITLRNETESTFVHSVDLHAVNGPGGGAVYTQTQPGDITVFNFEALAPGIYVYHCATPSVAHHISNGMYGLILVEPEGGLPLVDKEFYVVQGEIYTEQPLGSQGHLNFSHEKMLNETPEWYVFNGSAGALTTDENALYANTGDTIRIFMGVGGPNISSSFHVIGEIFDKVYPFGSFTTTPWTDVQTINVNPGGAWAVEFQVDIPGTYILVDHALSRVERGLVGLLHVDGEALSDTYSEGPVSP